MAYDLALNAQSHDLLLTSTNGFMIIDNAERVAQQIKTTLLLFKGEWFLNINFGVPYLEQVLIKNPRLNNIRSLMISKIKEVPGVQEVDRMDLYYNRARRTLLIDYDVSTPYGLLTRKEILNYGSS